MILSLLRNRFPRNYSVRATTTVVVVAVLLGIAGASFHIAGLWPVRGGQNFALTPSWSQNFAKQPDGAVSRTTWNLISGTAVPSLNNEAETYTDRLVNVRVDNGELLIEARHEQFGGRQYTSAYLTTRGKFAFTYGRLDICMKLPKGVGTWPAAWLWPAGSAYSPRSAGLSPYDPNAWILNGELDIAEGVGAEPGQIFPSVHTYDQMLRNPKATLTSLSVPDDTRMFHCYGIDKTPSSVSFTLDGKAYYTVRKPRLSSSVNWPFDQPYYLVLNLAMGGSWGGEQRAQYPPYGIYNQSGPWTLAVRSISYYPMAPR